MVEMNKEKTDAVSNFAPPVTLPEAPSRLCMDAIADAWSKTNGQAPAVFETQIAQELHMEGASHVDLNKAYMDQIKADEIKKFGPIVGNQVVKEGAAALGCHD